MYGPKNGDGAVFKLTRGGQETVLHSFGHGNDGNTPSRVLLEDASHNLYGTTASGGGSVNGIVFKIDASSRAETILHRFHGRDGSVPAGASTMDAVGNLYGTTLTGGTYGYGTVFKATAGGRASVLYNFCAVLNCTDGRNPQGGVIRDSARNLYGTTGGAERTVKAKCSS